MSFVGLSPPSCCRSPLLTNGRFREKLGGVMIVRDSADDGVAKFDCKTAFS